ncbi:S8 family serine peptidase [Pontixanthobacter aquaemixtae]|uniref:S8 family serine peptidase n=1 Tax=Pontixanthobacter aquaemixtae TaxID=1958940 RepID=A0A844ZVK2_9SPHN|nr:S8 family serine peptidase [Pontixanthobacter aquaemixtae]MXO91302.1 S8 family serine peptidase [Pontixanthobacter aquaemixtae]
MARFNLKHLFALAAFVVLGAAPVAAQLSLPPVGVPGAGDVLRPVTNSVSDLERGTLAQVERLAEQRLRDINRLVRKNRDSIELDAEGAPARRGELLVMGVTTAEIARAKAAGFALLGEEQIEGLDFSVVRLSVPKAMKLAEAEAALATLMPSADVSADNLHFTQGSTAVAANAATASRAAASSISVPVGVIDGAAGSSVPVVSTRGFAEGAPVPSNHGSAVASLLRKTGVQTIHVADVYGTDRAGGNALAIARGLGWLTSKGSRVVTISLVGPRNTVVQRAISAAQRKGVVVVAAVGNDGPAAPAAYPASYSGVVAVTGVDRRNRALIEAGRALHLDYAAPGADVYAINAKGKRIKVRGTSFATPLVAARVAAALSRGTSWRGTLNAQAVDLGKKGPDATYGNGLVCGGCAQK